MRTIKCISIAICFILIQNTTAQTKIEIAPILKNLMLKNLKLLKLPTKKIMIV